MRFRASGVAPLFLGTDGPTESQIKELDTLSTRFKSWRDETDEKLKSKLKLTDIMAARLEELKDARAQFISGNITLPQGAKTYIEEIVDKELYSYKTSMSNREIDKGSNEKVENEAIETYNRVFVTDHKKLVSGEKYADLSYLDLIGHPDIVCEKTKMVKDAKSSWSKKTFPKRVSDAENSTYTWQVRAYLFMLRGMTKDDSWRYGEVFHVLVETPEELVPEWEDDSLHVMTNVPDHMRVTVVPVELTDEHVSHMFRRMTTGIKYANEYRQEILNKNK